MNEATDSDIPLLAFMKDRLARVTWKGTRGLILEPEKTQLSLGLEQLKEHSQAILLDGRGIQRNFPDLTLLSQAPEDCELWVDSGVRRGEDVIDVVMADVANPIVSPRNLADPGQLEIAADYCEELMLALDWAGEWVANRAWKSLDWDGLGQKMRRWEVERILLLCHDTASLPHRPPATWEGLDLYITLFDKSYSPWSEAKVVRPIDNEAIA